MAAHIGIVSPPFTAPTGSLVKEVTSESSVEVITHRDATGVTKKAIPKPLVTKTYTMKGRGDAEFANVVAGSFSDDTAKITQAKQVESNEDIPEFDITAMAYTTLA